MWEWCPFFLTFLKPTNVMNFDQKNNFVTKHSGAEHFDCDLATYINVYPNSRIIPSLRKATEFEKEKLDGRMLLELLNHLSPEQILSKRKPMEQTVDVATLTFNTLMKQSEEEIQSMSYNDLKRAAIDLGLQPDKSKVGVIEQIKELIATRVHENNDTAADVGSGQDPEGDNAPAGDIDPGQDSKKKEESNLSTQE